MWEFALVIAVGILGGIAVGVQSPMSGAISQRVGGAASSLIIHVSGAVFSAILLFWRGGEQLSNWRALSWYMWLGGLFGLVLILSLSVTFPRLGAASAIVLIIVGQLSVGLVLDHFGWLDSAVHPLTFGRVLGVAALAVGAYLILRQA